MVDKFLPGIPYDGRTALVPTPAYALMMCREVIRKEAAGVADSHSAMHLPALMRIFGYLEAFFICGFVSYEDWQVLQDEANAAFRLLGGA